MKVPKKTGRLSLSIILAGLLWLLLDGSLWAGSFFVTRMTTGGSDRSSSSPSINSDGSKIAFDSDADLLDQGIPDNQSEIWLYDTAMLTFTRITFAKSNQERDSFSPSINSDGSKIAFYSDVDFLNQGIPDNQYEIWLYDTDTLTFTRITTGGSDRRSYSPSINSDGSKIAFESNADLLGQGIPDNQYEIWLYDIDTSTLTRITTGGSGRQSRYVSINSDGSKIAFHSNADLLGQGIPDNQYEIWLYDTDTLTFTRITTGESGRSSFSPSINRDGSKIAFRSGADFLGQGIPDNRCEIWLYDTETLTFTRITTGDINRLSYSPGINGDGSKIAFTSNADFLDQNNIDYSQYEIWLYDTNTLTLTRITNGESERESLEPRISGDGSKIAFFSDADFLGQGNVDQYHYEIWLAEVVTPTQTYLPLVLTGTTF